jgi:phage shock protein A
MAWIMLIYTCTKKWRQNMNSAMTLKFGDLTKKYAAEISYYEKLLEKLNEEMTVLKSGGEIEKTLYILSAKSLIINNIDILEKQIKPLKDTYFEAKEKNGYVYEELEKMLIKISVLLQKLIALQSINSGMLEDNMKKTRSKINSIRKRVTLTNAYKNHASEGVYIQEER